MRIISSHMPRIHARLDYQRLTMRMDTIYPCSRTGPIHLTVLNAEDRPTDRKPAWGASRSGDAEMPSLSEL